MNHLKNKLNELENKVSTLNNKNVIFINKIKNKIDDIIDIISDFQINNFTELEMTDELEKQIKEQKNIQKFLAIFGNLVINYSLNMETI